MRPDTRSSLEVVLAVMAAALLALAFSGSPIAQVAGYNEFADQRVLWHVPFAADVLSNAGFLLAGLAGIVGLRRLPARAISNMQRAMAMLFFAGVLLTALGSAWYHAHPDDAGLAVDRSAMAVAFAGLLGLAVAVHVSERAAALAGLALLVLGPVAVHAWASTGNLRPWVVLQGGGVLVLVWLAMLRPCTGAPQIDWWLVILAYAVAKLFEVADHEVYALTAGVMSGHTLKHLVAALAAWPVISGLAALRIRHRGQNRHHERAARTSSHPLGGA